MDKIEYKYGDNLNLTLIISMSIGFGSIIVFSNLSTPMIILGILIIIVSLYKLTSNTNEKGLLVIEDGKLIKTNLLGYTSEIILDRYEDFKLGAYRNTISIVATHKKTQMESRLLFDIYDTPIESIKDTILGVIEGTYVEIPKVKVEPPVDEYAYDPDDY